ncbi:glycosyltransferase family 39 protein [Zavarzinella formosa]|uniref:glycosyltransferase family 39 protein n=1 Tax=Zavarzinella formosa TaxID=360055 RepID=UPI0002F4D850|nr:glycosyltransferase family 39 protein [Zavarzinella formosa]
MTKPAVGVFVLCVAVFLANGRPLPEVDCVAAPYTAWSLVRHGSYDLRQYPELDRFLGAGVLERPDGGRFSMRPPGSAFAAVPAMLPFALFRETPLRDINMLNLGKLTATFSVAGAAVFFFLVCRRLAPSAAWPATVLFAFGTCLFSVASQALWMHGPAVFWLCAALYLLTCPECERRNYRLATGFSLGMAVLTRPTTGFFVVATLVDLLVRRQWRAAFWVSMGGVIPAIVLFHYQWVNFGSPLVGGYKDDNWEESPPLWLGLGGLLVAPSRGLFVYSPALLLALPGAWMLRRRGEEPLAGVRGMLLAWLAASVATLLFFARWYDWRGGWCYGPRFLCETMPLMCLLFAFAYAKLRNNWQRGFAIGLIAVSVGVHFLGVFGYGGYAPWQVRHMLPDQGRCLFSLEDTQIEAHVRDFFDQLTRSGRYRR